jgi:acetyl-CoA carboxylase biotin carboxyl carrier protein
LKNDLIMNLEPLAEALRLLENSRVAELEIETDEGSRLLRLRRNPLRRPPASLPVTEPTGEERAGPEYIPVEATFVGYFHVRQKSLAVGDAVTEEEILGEIESMRLMNPVTAPAAGRLAAVHVEDGQPVEYGQALYEIEPGS